MLSPEFTRVDFARALVRHSLVHQQKVRDHLPRFTVVRPGKVAGEVEVAEYPAKPVTTGEELKWNFEVTHAIADLRVALEFCAYDAFARSSGDGAPGWRRVSFPVCQTQQEFDGRVRGQFPKLKTVYPKAVDVFEAVQPFKSPDDWWLSDLDDLWNECKNRNLNYFTQATYVVGAQGQTGLASLQVIRAIRFSRTNRNLLNLFETGTRGVETVISGSGSAICPV